MTELIKDGLRRDEKKATCVGFRVAVIRYMSE